MQTLNIAHLAQTALDHNGPQEASHRPFTPLQSATATLHITRFHAARPGPTMIELKFYAGLGDLRMCAGVTE